MAYEQILGKVSSYIMIHEATELDRFYLIQYQGIQQPHVQHRLHESHDRGSSGVSSDSWKYR